VVLVAFVVVFEAAMTIAEFANPVIERSLEEVDCEIEYVAKRLHNFAAETLVAVVVVAAADVVAAVVAVAAVVVVEVLVHFFASVGVAAVGRVASNAGGIVQSFWMHGVADVLLMVVM
jgi:hypothetical protein